MPKIPFQNLYPRASPLAIDLLNKLLTFDPAKRITVEEALAHPYLSAYHDEDDEPSHTQSFDFSFEVVESMEDMRSRYPECQTINYANRVSCRNDCTGSHDI